MLKYWKKVAVCMLKCWKKVAKGVSKYWKKVAGMCLKRRLYLNSG